MALSDYFDRDFVFDMADDADNDSDAVSITFLSPSAPKPTDPDDGGFWRPTPDERIDGALVFIKGEENVLAFERWAEERGLLTQKAIRDDYVPPTATPSGRN